MARSLIAVLCAASLGCASTGANGGHRLGSAIPISGNECTPAGGSASSCVYLTHGAATSNTNYAAASDGATNLILNSPASNLYLAITNGLYIDMTTSAIAPVTAGALTSGAATSPWGSGYLGGDSSAHYTSFELPGGTHGGQAGLLRHRQVWYTQTATGTQTAVTGSSFGVGTIFCPAAGSMAGVTVDFAAVGATGRPANGCKGRMSNVCVNASGTSTCGSSANDITTINVGTALCAGSAPTVTVVAGTSGCFNVSVACATLTEGNIDYQFEVYVDNN